MSRRNRKTFLTVDQLIDWLAHSKHEKMNFFFSWFLPEYSVFPNFYHVFSDTKQYWTTNCFTKPDPAAVRPTSTSRWSCWNSKRTLSYLVVFLVALQELWVVLRHRREAPRTHPITGPCWQTRRSPRPGSTEPRRVPWIAPIPRHFRLGIRCCRLRICSCSSINQSINNCWSSISITCWSSTSGRPSWAAPAAKIKYLKTPFFGQRISP